MRKLLLILLLSLPALALPTPEEVVSKLYRTHLKTQDVRKTVAQLPRGFTPEFQELLDKALSKVDTDIFTHQKANLADFELAETTVHTTQAQINVQIWTGGRLGQHLSEPSLATVYLLDLEDGVGYRVDDIQFKTRPRFKIRDFLSSLLNS